MASGRREERRKDRIALKPTLAYRCHEKLWYSLGKRTGGLNQTAFQNPFGCFILFASSLDRLLYGEEDFIGICPLFLSLSCLLSLRTCVSLVFTCVGSPQAKDAVGVVEGGTRRVDLIFDPPRMIELERSLLAVRS